MNILLIFALFVFADGDEKLIHSRCKEVVIFPDAGPVQFWLNDCDTYNETIPKGVHYKCFCAPWKCTDEIKIQFRNYFDASEIVTEEDVNAISLPALNLWENIAGTGDYAWTTGASPTVNLPGIGFPGVGSQYLAAEYPFEDGKEYTITINYNFVVNSGTQNPRTTGIAILDDDNNVLFIQTATNATVTGAYSISITFTATEATTKVGIRHLSGRNVDLTITSATGTRTDLISTYPDPKSFELVIRDEEEDEVDRIPFDAVLFENGLFYTHSTSFIPSDSSICEQQIRLLVENLSESPDSIVAKSDCLNITESDAVPTILVEYSSNKNFNGLVFENLSPDQTFYLRIPAVFFHERHPQEDEVARLSSSVIKLNSSITDQKQMETDFIPYYFHKKIELVLMMPSLLIEDEYWTKQESYSIDEGSKRWPTKRATCWLTKRDTLQRNVI